MDKMDADNAPPPSKKPSALTLQADATKTKAIPLDSEDSSKTAIIGADLDPK
jgi:hypothetical protein